MAQAVPLEHWLRLYATDLYQWQETVEPTGQVSYYRRQGVVENLFDIDGIDFEGRADLNIHLTVSFNTRFDGAAVKQHILLAWALMRQLHILLSARSLYLDEISPELTGRHVWVDKCFVYTPPRSVEDAVDAAESRIDFLDETYSEIDVSDFSLHLLNSSRLVDAQKALARLFVLPPKPHALGPRTIDFIFIAGHQIADGLTVYRWMSHFTDLLSTSRADLMQSLERALEVGHRIHQRLPPAQESLYPKRASNVARQRWQWLITRLLRHVRKPAPAAFANPLRRADSHIHTRRFAPTYGKVIDYDKVPPNNSFSIGLDLSQRATHNLFRLSRSAGISLGSGAFTLVGMVMMRLEELRNPGIHFTERLPFVGSFPLNPRPFLSGKPTTGKEDSVMLAFSDGVTLPFLPSDLNLEKSFKILGRLAHRQLRQYQKKPRSLEEEKFLGIRSPTQLLPALYLDTMERLNTKVRPEQKVMFNPQGDFPAKPGNRATCGISSIGDRSSLTTSSIHDLNDLEGRDLVANFANLKSCVRAREGEFLVGAGGTKDVLGFFVSSDASVIDPKKAEDWKTLMQAILDYDMDGKTNVTMKMRSRL